MSEIPEPKIEVVIELLQEMVRREFDSELVVIYMQGGDFEAYQKAVEGVQALPTHQKRTMVVWVCLEDAELLRYPALDVEFNLKEGAQKLGVTGKPKNVAKVMRLIGGQRRC